MTITKINPASMHQSPAFAQGVLVEAGSRLLFIGGQDGVDASGTVVPGGLGAQTEQALRNVLTVLAEVGASQENVVRMTIYLTAGADVNEGFAASRAVWGMHQTAITVVSVAAFANPEFLVEIDAIAAV